MKKREHPCLLPTTKRQKVDDDERLHKVVAVLLQTYSRLLSTVDLAHLMQVSQHQRAQVDGWLQSVIRLPSRLQLFRQIHRPTPIRYLLLNQSGMFSVHMLPSLGTTTIGRSSKNDIRIEPRFGFVSRRHSAVHCRANGELHVDVHGRPPLCIGDEEELPAGTQNYHLQPNQRVDIYVPPMPGQWIWFQVLLGMPPRSRVIV